MRKKKVVFLSNWHRSATGFGRHMKGLLKYLYNTGKYDIVEFATGTNWSNSALQHAPWKAFGSLPDTQEEMQMLLAGLNPQDQQMRHRDINYGGYYIDRIISENKPDVFFGVEDIWAFNGFFTKRWWNKITCAIHSTLDSLPILPEAVKAGKMIENYYVWAKFAEKAMHELGHKHVKTLHGCIETDYFFRLKDDERQELRKSHNIPSNAFIIGFVFRNQLRKSVVKLLQGFQIFCKQNPQTNAYLLLHTNFSEGWNISERCRELGVDPSRVLVTYLCNNCREYEVKPFRLPAGAWSNERIDPNLGQRQNCPFCETKESQFTVGVSHGVTEIQLNEIYNLMDVYCHPFTSGGQEIPLQEAKLTELITLCTNYSCGEEYCTEESGGLPLDWSETREFGTEFKKAATSETHIAEQLTKVLKMNKNTLKRMGETARKFVLDGFNVKFIGHQVEKLLDSAPFIVSSDADGVALGGAQYRVYDFNLKEPPRNPDYQPKDIKDAKEWLKDMYENILGMYVKDDDPGLRDWMEALQKGRTRESVYRYFIGVAAQKNAEAVRADLTNYFPKDGRKKVLLVIKESIGDCFIVSSLFESIKNQYPDHDLYVSTQQKFQEIFIGNPYIHKVVDYLPAMENELVMTGHGTHKGFVDVFMYPALSTQKQLNYLTNGNVGLDLRKYHGTGFVPSNIVPFNSTTF